MVQFLTRYMLNPSDIPISGHTDAVATHHRFTTVKYRGSEWDLCHLESFAMRVALPIGSAGAPVDVDLVVLFSCHCFTREVAGTYGLDELYDDGRETRLLDAERYDLSVRFLPRLIRELWQRRIQVAARSIPNYVTVEATTSSGRSVHYAVFFEVEKDTKRRKRLMLRVQSGYPIEVLTKRLRTAGKVTFAKLLSAAYEGKPIRS